MAKIRELSGLIHGHYDTETQLAKKLGWSKQKLNRITNGMKEPDLAEAAAIATALDVSIDQIATIFLPGSSPNGQR